MSSNRKKEKDDENYEKPSKHKQWQERSEKPIAARAMTKEEIEEHRLHLVQSYQCEDSDISYDFQKIIDENDEDRDDCLWLKYKMKCVVAGKPTVREIFNIKIPIPDDIRRMAEQMRKQQASRTPMRKPLKALPAPSTPSTPVYSGPTIEELPPSPQPEQTEEPQVARPKLRKPTRATKK